MISGSLKLNFIELLMISTSLIKFKLSPTLKFISSTSFTLQNLIKDCKKIHISKNLIINLTNLYFFLSLIIYHIPQKSSCISFTTSHIQ